MRRLFAVTFASAVALIALAAPAGAATPTIRIREATLTPNGNVRLVVSLGGDAGGSTLNSGDVRVTESGKSVGPVTASALETTKQLVSVMLVLDSGSTSGRPIADAGTAAERFVRSLPPSVLAGVVSFTGAGVVRSAPTTDRAATVRAIADGARGSTALYDGVVQAAAELAKTAGLHRIVLFSDGRDTASAATLTDAISAASKASAAVDAVVLKTLDADVSSLGQLARKTRGSLVQVSDSAGLAKAFGAIAKEFGSLYVLSYAAHATGSELEIAVALGAAADSIVVTNPRRAAPPPAMPAPGPAAPPVGALSGSAGLYIGLAAAFAFLAIFGGMLVWRTTRTDGGVSLARGIKALSGRGLSRSKKSEHEGLSPMANLGRAAEEMLQMVPSSRKFEDELQAKLERAGWPMRASEFLVMQAGATIAGLAVGWAVTGRWFFGIAAAAAGFAAPAFALKQRIAKRHAAFLRQLPETLQLLAGSLQAGYGFLQAVDTLVKECAEPTASEFSRVIAEARLGRPLEDALGAMADRLGSDDFRWVVLAINIQRQVGGNLAELLKTVAGTLREREQVRRQIKTLSAEGRLSAIILGVMPFAIAGYLTMVNPGYLSKLFATSTGRTMVFAALGLMGAGVLWLRKVIKINV